jgi:hypothetical protein
MNKYLIIIIILLILVIGGFFIKASLTGNSIQNDNLDKISIHVSIPCEGHVSYITSELKKIKGIGAINYLQNFNFEISYDSSKITKEEILNQNVFKEYHPKLII